MKIAILSRNRNLYSTSRLIEASRERGHQPLVLDTIKASLQLGLPRMLQRGNPHLPVVDAVIPRIGASVTQRGLTVVRHYEDQGVYLTATSEGITQSRDKYRSQKLLKEAGLPVPHTLLVEHALELQGAISRLGGLPVVLKRLESTQGRGVMLLHNRRTVKYVIEALRRQPVPILVQEYVPEAKGRDIRLLMVGGRCVAAMERIAAKGDFRSNLHLGGTARPVQPEAALEELARQTVELFDLGVAGVDVILSEAGPLLLEANSSPGLEGIEGTTGVDVASAVVGYLEEKMRENAGIFPSHRHYYPVRWERRVEIRD